MKRMLLGLLLLGLVFQPVFSQEKSSNWNFGVSEGFGGVHYFFFPSVDVLYKRHTLRVSPMLAAQSIQYQFAFAHLLTKEEGNLDLVVALSYTRSNDQWQLPFKEDRIWFVPSDRLSLLTGIRYDFGKRLTLGIMLGPAFQKARETGNLAVTEKDDIRLKAGFEANFGVRLFKFSN